MVSDEETIYENYQENSERRNILEVVVDYPSELQKVYSDLPFLPERMKIGKCQRLVCNVMAR